MKQEIMNLLLKKRDEDELSIKHSLNNVIRDQFINPQAVLTRIAKKVDLKSLIEISRYYVDDFIRTTSSLSINVHTDNQPPYFHKHEFIELMYILEGNCKQHIDTIDNTLILEQGQAIIINPKTIHAVYPVKKEDFVIKMFIPQSFLYMSLEMADEKDSNLSNVLNIEKLSTDYQYIVLRNLNKEQIDMLLENLIIEYYSTEQFRLVAMKTYLLLIFIELFRNNPKFYEKKNNANSEKILEYIEASYNVVSLGNLADHLGYSEKYMSHLVKELFGTSFSKLVRSIRIKKAVFFLLNTDLTIEEISHELGFKHSSNFYRLIGNELGVTPNQIRLNNFEEKSREK